jgi:hypothetical protein
MSSPAVVNTKTSTKLSLVLGDLQGNPREIKADSSGTVPDRFELLKVGDWDTPRHGHITLTRIDLLAMVAHFNEGLAVSGAGKLKLPINYEHIATGKAAGWFVPAVEGDTLWATQVEWTPAAQQALVDQEYKCISAEFYPGNRGGWIDPLNENHIVPNVIEGAALTNIPLYSILEPVMASAAGGQQTKVFLVNASEDKENRMPTLEDVLAKNNDNLTEEDRQVLVDNKEDLSVDQRQKFGFEVTQKSEENNNQGEEEQVTSNVDPETAAVAASIKAGTHVLLEKSKFDELNNQVNASAKQVEALRRKDVEATVKAHAKRGAIKADRIDHWTGLIMADDKMLDTLAELPSNDILASAQGDSGTADATELNTELHEKVVAAREKEENKGRLYSEIRASIIKTDDKFKSLRSN